MFDAEAGGQPGLLGGLPQPGDRFSATAMPAPAGLRTGCTAPTPAVSGDGGHEIRLRILLHSRQATAAAVVVVEGPQLVRLHRQRLWFLVVGLGHQDPDLPREPLEEDAGEEVGFLLASGTRLQHHRQQLQRLPSAQGRHLEQSLRLLEVR